MSPKGYVAGGGQPWIYEIAPLGQKVLLLTRGGVCVVGQWRGQVGEAFWAWAPLPKRDVQREAALGLR